MSIYSQIERINGNFRRAIEKTKEKLDSHEDFKSSQLSSKLNLIHIADEQFFQYAEKKLTHYENNEISSLGRYFFSGQGNLSSIEFNNLKFVDGYAFNNCSSIVEIDLPSINKITSYSFANMQNLSCAKLHNLEQAPGSNFFEGCNNMKRIILDPSNPYLKTGPQENDFRSKDDEWVYYVLDNLSSYVNEDCIYGSDGMFDNNDRIRYISLPNIQESKMITEAQNLQSVDYRSATYGSYTFYYCPSLEYVNFQNLESFSTYDYLFNKCTKLSSIHIDNQTLKSVGDGYGWPDAAIVDSSGTTVFFIAPGIERFYNDEIESIGDCFTYFDDEDDCVHSLKYIELPNCTAMNENEGGWTFYAAENLEHCIFPKVTSLLEEDFNCCYELIDAVFASNLTNIGSLCFGYCSKLSSIGTNSVGNVGNQAFINCSKLENVNFLSSTTYIGSSAFRSCNSIKTLELNELTSIAGQVFAYCSSLSSVYAPKVKSIGVGAFQFTNMKKFDFGNDLTSVPTIMGNTFNGVYNTVSCYIPDALYENWITATNWVSLISQNKVKIIKQSER